MSISSKHISPTTTQASNDKNPLSPQEKPKAGASWIATEQHVLPHNRLWIVFPGLMACIFMAALVQVSIPLSRSLHRRRITSNRPSLVQHCPLSSNISVGAKITDGLEGIWYTSFPFC